MDNGVRRLREEEENVNGGRWVKDEDCDIESALDEPRNRLRIDVVNNGRKLAISYKTL